MEIFSTIDLVNQCLIDEERVAAFAEAVKKYVKPGHVVLDVGTGSGILSLLAAKAGAHKVIALEIDPYLIKVFRSTVTTNNLQNSIQIIKGDARKINIHVKKPVDIVLAEMITTGLVDEHQISVMNNLINQGLVSEKTIVIPSELETTFELVESNFNTYGFEIPIVKHLWKQYSTNPKFNSLTDIHFLNRYNFKKITIEKFNVVTECQIKKSGKLNGILLRSSALFTEEVKLNDTISFIAPVIVPIRPRKVREGDVVTIKISYSAGAGYNKFNVSYK